jgi:hypothetical protein
LAEALQIVDVRPGRVDFVGYGEPVFPRRWLGEPDEIRKFVSRRRVARETRNRTPTI